MGSFGTVWERVVVGAHSGGRLTETAEAAFSWTHNLWTLPRCWGPPWLRPAVVRPPSLQLVTGDTMSQTHAKLDPDSDPCAECDNTYTAYSSSP